jgi:chromosome segregation ATPase
MTTTAVDFDLFARRERARWASIAIGATGKSDEAYRADLAEVRRAQDELAGLEKHLANLNAKADAAVDRHSEICGPLQAEIADPATTMERRVSARAEVNQANDELSAVLTGLEPQIAACKQEIEFCRTRAGALVQIENAFASNGSPEEQERIRALRKAINFVDPLCFAARKAVADAEIMLSNTRSRRDRHGRPDPYAVAEAERNLAQAQTVLEIASAGRTQAQQEIDTRRAARLAKLYE